MFFKKKKNNKKMVVGQVYAGRPTDDIIQEIGYSDSDDITKRYIVTDQLSRFISKMLEKYAIDKTPFDLDCEIHVVTLDNDYMSWLKEKGITHDTHSVKEYVMSLSPTEQLNLARKHKMDRDIFLYGLPFVIITNNQSGSFENNLHLKLDLKLKNLLKAYIENEFPGYQVYIPKYVMREDVFYHSQPQMMNMAKSFFDDNVEISYSMYDEQEIISKEANMMITIIPFFIYKKHNQTSFHLSDFIDEDSNLIKYGETQRAKMTESYKVFESEFNIYLKSMNLKSISLMTFTNVDDIPLLQQALIDSK